MNSQIKICQNCSQDFTIEPEDFAFYEKIKVPAPTFCPQCRMMRRFTWRNERIFHHNVCAMSGKKIISGFAPDSQMTVYDRELWWGDEWDAIRSGREYDFSQPFFTQFRALLAETPVPAVFNARTENCAYSQHTGEYKNGYLVSASWEGENISYSSRCNQSKDCTDVFVTQGCELCYEVVSAVKCYRVSFSQQVENCTNSAFLFDCKGCTDCFGCVGLRNKSNYIFNEPYTKEEYKKKLAEISTESFGNIQMAKEKFATIKKQALRKYANILRSENVTGDNIEGSANCHSCFDIVGDVRDCKFVLNALQLEQTYDGYGIGGHAELLYEVFDSGVTGANQRFGIAIYASNDIQYSYNCHSSSHLFACVGLRNKQYCILNKQYTKEEYEALVPKIIQHMNDMPYTDKKGRVYKYGEFFPPELSPFAYNETIAQEYFPLTKEEAEKQGYKWKDPDTKDYKITTKPQDLPDHVKDVTDSITKEVIGCMSTNPDARSGRGPDPEASGCTTAFKIIPQELQFYRQMNLPLPRLCPNCRHYERLAQRNPLKLWHRTCQCAGTKSENGIYTNTATHTHHGIEHCSNEFETSYPPERKEIVYCEACYQQEVV